MKEEYLAFEKLKVWEKAIDYSVEAIEFNRKHFRLIEQLEINKMLNSLIYKVNNSINQTA